MEASEILERLEGSTGQFERAAVDAAIALREEITPELLRILEETIDRAAELADDADYMGHLYAMFLLAQFRETRAYPLVLRFAALPGELTDALGGDFIATDLGRLLASVCGGDLTGIQTLIENEDVDEWCRGAGVCGLATLVAGGQKDRDEIIQYFASLYRGKLKREWSHVWDSLVSHTSDLYPEELLDDIRRAYDDDLVDPGVITLKDVRKDLKLGKDLVLERLADNEHLSLVNDAVTEMAEWECFGEHDAFADRPREPYATAPIVRASPKVGRNEPCPCGSGKKHKKCCGA